MLGSACGKVSFPDKSKGLDSVRENYDLPGEGSAPRLTSEACL